VICEKDKLHSMKVGTILSHFSLESFFKPNFNNVKEKRKGNVCNVICEKDKLHGMKVGTM